MASPTFEHGHSQAAEPHEPEPSVHSIAGTLTSATGTGPAVVTAPVHTVPVAERMVTALRTIAGGTNRYNQTDSAQGMDQLSVARVNVAALVPKLLNNLVDLPDLGGAKYPRAPDLEELWFSSRDALQWYDAWCALRLEDCVGLLVFAFIANLIDEVVIMPDVYADGRLKVWGLSVAEWHSIMRGQVRACGGDTRWVDIGEEALGMCILLQSGEKLWEEAARPPIFPFGGLRTAEEIVVRAESACAIAGAMFMCAYHCVPYSDTAVEAATLSGYLNTLQFDIGKIECRIGLGSVTDYDIGMNDQVLPLLKSFAQSITMHLDELDCRLVRGVLGCFDRFTGLCPLYMKRALERRQGVRIDMDPIEVARLQSCLDLHGGRLPEYSGAAGVVRITLDGRTLCVPTGVDEDSSEVRLFEANPTVENFLRLPLVYKMWFKLVNRPAGSAGGHPGDLGDLPDARKWCERMRRPFRPCAPVDPTLGARHSRPKTTGNPAGPVCSGATLTGAIAAIAVSGGRPARPPVYLGAPVGRSGTGYDAG